MSLRRSSKRSCGADKARRTSIENAQGLIVIAERDTDLRPAVLHLAAESLEDVEALLPQAVRARNDVLS